MFDEARLECESAGNVRDECKWKGEMIAYANVVSILEKMKGAGRTGRSIEKKASREAMIERERGKKITTMERRDTARPIV